MSFHILQNVVIVENPLVEQADIAIVNSNIQNMQKYIEYNGKVYLTKVKDFPKQNEIHIQSDKCIYHKGINIIGFDTAQCSVRSVTLDILSTSKEFISKNDILNDIKNITQPVVHNKQLELNGTKVMLTFDKTPTNFIDSITKIHDDIVFNVTNTKKNVKFINYDPILHNDNFAVYIDVELISNNDEHRMNDCIYIKLHDLAEFFKKKQKDNNYIYKNQKYIYKNNKYELSLTITDHNLCAIHNTSSDAIFKIENDWNATATFTLKNSNMKDVTNATAANNIDVTITNGTTDIYNLNDVTTTVKKRFLNNYTRIGDSFKTFSFNDKVEISVVSIDELNYSTDTKVFNDETKVNVVNNFKLNKYALESTNAYTLKTIDVVVSADKIPQDGYIVVSKYDLLSRIRNLKYILMTKIEYDLDHKDLKIALKEFNVNEKVDNISSCTIAKFDALTDIRFTLETDKIITDKNESCLSKITLSKEDFRQLREKFLDLGLSGINEQIDQLMKEVFLPRSGLLPKSLLSIIKVSKGVILYGPPGTGKTTFASQIGKVLECPDSRITKITASSVLSKWLGNSEEKIRELFAPAKQAMKDHGNMSPLYLIIIDEIDSILKPRGNNTSSTTDTIVNQLLGEMDGLEKLDNVLVIGMTNRIDLIDSAALRPGRFGSAIEFALPNNIQRNKIYELYYSRFVDTDIFDNSINLKQLSDASDGFSGADIENVFNQVINTYMNNILNNIDKQINQNDVVEIVHNLMKFKPK